MIKHGLRNAFIPVLTVISLQFGALLGGTVIVAPNSPMKNLTDLVAEGRQRPLDCSFVLSLYKF